MINKSILDAFERFWFHVSAKLGNKADIDHTHDDRYFTETEANGFLANKADKTHTHSIANVTNLQSSLDSKASTSHTHNSIEVLDTRNDNPAPSESDFDKKKITADFKYISKIGSPVGFSGTYCGLISFAPWTETSGGHGYQMAFGYGGTGIPRLAIRASDLSATAWDSWYKIYTSADKPTKADIGLSSVEDKSSATIRGELTKDNVVKALGYTPPTTNTTYSVGTTSALGLTKLYAGTGTATDGTMTQAAINTALAGKASSSHSHSVATQTANGYMSSTDKKQLDNGGTAIVTTGGTGDAYTATISGITALNVGTTITIIPNVNSATVSPTLNVNSLGAKNIRLPILGLNTSSTTTSSTNAWLAANKPVTLKYDGTYWVVTDNGRASAQYLYGAVPIANGGTGATTLYEARANLRIPTIIIKKEFITKNGDEHIDVDGVSYFTVYVYDMDIIESDVVDINLDINSHIIAEDCGLKGVTESFNGGVRMFSKEIPTRNMSGTIVITKGV